MGFLHGRYMRHPPLPGVIKVSSTCMMLEGDERKCMQLPAHGKNIQREEHM